MFVTEVCERYFFRHLLQKLLIQMDCRLSIVTENFFYIVCCILSEITFNFLLKNSSCYFYQIKP